MRSNPRRIWLCADDYGISPGVSAAIRELVRAKRINATSVMVASPNFNADEAAALDILNSGEKRTTIGLHVTLTAPFKPVTPGFAPLRNGQFFPLSHTMHAAATGRLQPDRLIIEIAGQLRKFIDSFGYPPDFLDGHQHVQLFPRIRDAFLRVVVEGAPEAWVRQCGRTRPTRLHDSKALTLDILSVAFRRKAKKLGLAYNPGFSGTYSFKSKADIARLFPGFLAGLPDGGLVMCHPGFVDVELNALDPLTTLREREFAYFNSDVFSKALSDHNIALAEPATMSE